MNIGDILIVDGRVENQGLPFNLELEVKELTTVRGNKLVTLVNPLNNDSFGFNLTLGRIGTKEPGFYSDDFTLFNKTQNIRII